MPGSKLCIVQFDDRFEGNESKLGSQLDLANHVEQVCKTDKNCMYYRFGSSFASESDKPPYWNKVDATKSVVDMDSDCKYTVWLDTDAALAASPTVVKKTLDHELAEKHMLFAGDNPSLGWGSPFNAGVFAVKNGRGGRAIMEKWANGWEQVKDDWNQEEDRWKCTACGWWGCFKCGWAGPSYEQGYFAEHLIDDESVSKIDWCRLQQGGHEDEREKCAEYNPLTYHFAGIFKENIPSFLQQSRQ